MPAILSLLLVVTLSILVTRVAAIFLTHTGMASQAARFQARSAFSGAGIYQPGSGAGPRRDR